MRHYAKQSNSGHARARDDRVASLRAATPSNSPASPSRFSKRLAVRPKNMRPSATASPCVFAGDTYFCSAKGPFTPGPDKVQGIYAATVEAQVRQSMRNLLDGLEEAGLTFANVVASNVYLDDIDDFPRMNRVYAQSPECPDAHDGETFRQSTEGVNEASTRARKIPWCGEVEGLATEDASRLRRKRLRASKGSAICERARTSGARSKERAQRSELGGGAGVPAIQESVGESRRALEGGKMSNVSTARVVLMGNASVATLLAGWTAASAAADDH